LSQGKPDPAGGTAPRHDPRTRTTTTMEFEIDQARFVSALALAQTVADKRSTMPVLANVLLRATSDGHVVCAATDMMLAVTESVPATVHTPGSLTLAVRHLHDVIRSLPDGTLRLKRLDNHWAELRAPHAEFKLMGMAETDFPELPDPKGLELVPVAGHVLSDLIAKTQFSVSTDEARVNLSGVLFESAGTTATMVSTDGHRLTKFTAPFTGPALTRPVVIPRKGMLEMRRVLDRVEGTIELAVSDQHLFLRASELTLSVKLNNVTFPPYKQVIPKDYTRLVLAERQPLLSALATVAIMAPEKTSTVRIELQPSTLQLTADDPDRGFAHVALPVEYDGEGLKAGFNARYLRDVLEAMTSERVRLEFLGELDPCVLRPDADSDYLGVVMPMRI